MKHSQCNDYTAVTVQWHKAIMQILKVLYKYNNRTSVKRCSHKYRGRRWAVLCPCCLYHSWLTINQHSFSITLIALSATCFNISHCCLIYGRWMWFCMSFFWVGSHSHFANFS